MAHNHQVVGSNPTPAPKLEVYEMLMGKAIEILTILSKGGNFIILNDNQDAVKLGLEGLKRIEACRKAVTLPCNQLLPGEVIKSLHDSRRPDPRYPGILLLDN